MEPIQTRLPMLPIPEGADPFNYLPNDLTRYLLSFADEISRMHTLSLVCRNFKKLFPPSRLISERAKPATRAGWIPILSFMKQKLNMPLRSSLCSIAAAGNQQKMIEWLRKNKADWSETTCSVAAFHGHLDLLIWLRANGCPWDSSVPIMAARNGHLEIIKWAADNGCKGEYDKALKSDRILINAAEFGHLHVVEWCFSQLPLPSLFALDSAARGGHVHILQWLRAKKFPWTGCVTWNATTNRHLAFLQTALADGAPYHLPELLKAAKPHPHILEWLQNEFVPSLP